MGMVRTRLRKPLFLPLLLPVLFLLLLLPLLAPGGDAASAAPRLSIPAPAPAVQTSPARGLIARVYFRSQAERDRLAGELDALEVSTAGGYLTVLTDQAGIDSLKQQGLRVDVDALQTVNINSPVKFGNSPDNFYGGYHTVEEMQQFMDQEAATYPNLAEKVQVGESWCKTHPGQCTQPDSWDGFNLYAMHITNRNIPGPKPVFWFNSGIHALEIAPPEVAIDFIDYLLSGYNTNADAHWLVDYQDIWVMLPNNPDGHHIVESGGGNPVQWRKNADNANGCTTFPVFGTDNNRNFPFMWNCCNGSSGDPCNDAYHGPYAGSEEETQAVVNKIRQLIPDQRGPDINDPAPITTTGTFIDIHSFSPVNLYPWAMVPGQSPNDTDLKNLNLHMSSTTADPPGSDYTSCQFGDCLYIADGTTNDWVYGELGAAAFATEIGEVFFPPYSETQNILWPQNRGMLLYLSKVARMPYLMTRGPDSTLVATQPMTVTQGVTSRLAGTINYAWDYHEDYNAYMQNVAAAEYYVDTPPWAGGTPLAMQPVDGSFDSPVEAVEATVQTGSLSVGRHILFVRGRGVNDYEGLQSWGPVSATWLVVQPYASPTPTLTGTPPTLTPTRTLTPTPTNTAIPCSDPVILNGGFETGSFSPGWTILDTNPAPTIRSSRLHAGDYAAFLGSIPGSEPRGDSSMYQQFTVPANGGTLSFWYYPFSRDHVNFDWQDAYITDGHGSILATIMHVCEGSETWTNMTYSLDAFAGQTIRVEFLVHQDGAGDVTNMYVDDVLLLEPCATPSPPTATPTFITNTPTRTASRTGTGVATNTNTPTHPPTGVPTDTQTTAPTSSVTYTPTHTPVGVITSTPTRTTTPCVISFSDVHPSDYFYEAVSYLYCHGAISGYGDGTFRPYANTTRGQLTKIVVLAEGWPLVTPSGTPSFSDVPPGHTFYPYVETAASHSIISGYADGTFKPGNNVTRGQLCKIIVLAEGWQQVCPSPGHFSDVPAGSPFYCYIETAYSRGIISGYADGTFKPGNNATRGQISKIVYNAVTQR